MLKVAIRAEHSIRNSTGNLSPYRKQISTGGSLLRAPARVKAGLWWEKEGRTYLRSRRVQLRGSRGVCLEVRKTGKKPPGGGARSPELDRWEGLANRREPLWAVCSQSSQSPGFRTKAGGSQE